METWVYLVIISSIISGLSSFLDKVIALQRFNKNDYLLLLVIFQILTSSALFLYLGDPFYIGRFFLLLVILRSIFSLEKKITKLKSLEHIESSLFFPASKLLKIAGTFLTGYIIFGESINLNEGIFILLGAISILILSYKKGGTRNKNYIKGIYYLLISSLFLILTATINKYVGENYSPSLYIMLCNLISLPYMLSKIKLSSTNFGGFSVEITIYSLLSALFGLFSLYSLILAFGEGKIVIVGMIGLLSLFIPIVLSHIFLNEKITKLKLLGMVIFFGNLIIYLN